MHSLWDSRFAQRTQRMRNSAGHYMSTLSKILSPGIRLGWVIALSPLSPADPAAACRGRCWRAARCAPSAPAPKRASLLAGRAHQVGPSGDLRFVAGQQRGVDAGWAGSHVYAH